MKIKEFVDLVRYSRKRTGIALLNPDRIDFLEDFIEAGITIIDLSYVFSGQVIVSDQSFLEILTKSAHEKATGFTNAEIYLSPRFEERYYLESLMPKLLNSEPRKPIFLIFYSKKLYEKIKPYYLNYQPTRDHYFEEDF